MGGDKRINNISLVSIKKWLRKNYWEFVGHNSKGHEEWEYNLEVNGEYLRDVLTNSSGMTLMQKEPLSTHLKDNVKEYTIVYIYEYMGLARDEFLDSFRNGKKFKEEELIEKFIKAQKAHSDSLKTIN